MFFASSLEPPRSGLSPFRRSGNMPPEAVARLHRVDESRETFIEKARSAEGFGLIELLMAMIILNVGILAIVASFNASVITLNRASRITTAAVLGDQQMELYRAIKYDSIRLASSTIPAVPPYTTDTAYYAPQVTTPACTGAPIPNECNASRTATGADGKSYRVDTYIVQTTPTSNPPTPPGGRSVKVVTIVVRDATNVNRVFARQASTFDQSTG